MFKLLVLACVLAVVAAKPGALLSYSAPALYSGYAGAPLAYASSPYSYAYNYRLPYTYAAPYSYGSYSYYNNYRAPIAYPGYGYIA